MSAILSFHKYRYFPYEKVLAKREAETLLGSPALFADNEGMSFAAVSLPDRAKRLAYFSRLQHGQHSAETSQALLEQAASAGKNRQATRYSVHGLHDYKGKFNPQIVKAILNIFDVREGYRVLDPFCGSGTTLVECEHMGVRGVGYDLNPLAVFIANAKLLSLSEPAAGLATAIDKVQKALARVRSWAACPNQSDRSEYLARWFTPRILSTIEIVRAKIIEHAGVHSPALLAIASNLLRDYSLQDPKDLRIRRRVSPLPDRPFIEIFISDCQTYLGKVRDVQSLIGHAQAGSKAILRDNTSQISCKTTDRFDAAITSPPYATALPYIDTQRLSLVWLELISPGEIFSLEAKLVGSREVRGASKASLREGLRENCAALPDNAHKYCMKLERKLGDGDGFRRQAVPLLLYRYFESMQRTFRAVHAEMKPGTPFALVVGHNHTILGGARFDIDTPKHLSEIAVTSGWALEELMPLQTYQRFGYHAGNAVAAETLIMLRRA